MWQGKGLKQYKEGALKKQHATAYKIPFLIYNLAFERKRWATEKEIRLFDFVDKNRIVN